MAMHDPSVGCPTYDIMLAVQFFDNADSGTVIAYANIVNNFRDEVLTALTGLDAVRSHCELSEMGHPLRIFSIANLSKHADHH